jgi:threonylcarbamoyladenosine tRNA methylthiotransferase MtaB
MGAPRIQTFGCRLNAFESEIIGSHVAASGAPDTIVFNTCAVTNEAVRQARQAIRKARRENPDRKIIVTGCAAQVQPDTFAAMAEVDLVLGNSEKLEAGSYRAGAFGMDGDERVRVNDIMAVTETANHLIEGFGERARAFVQIQNGCDHRCTFCIIPYARGNSRSVPMGGVVEQIRHLVARGFNEIVLTGVDITSYGSDLPGQPTLGRLAKSILNGVPELARLRLSSIDSIEVDDTLLDLIANEERLMPHLHLSLQSGDDMILKRMKRRHSRADTIFFCDTVRRARPDMVFGADIIAGFPTETDAMFENSRKIIRECGLTWLHVFPFSPKQGTPAARMPQVPRDVIKARAKVLREDGDAASQTLRDRLCGTRTQILVEQGNMGRTPEFAPVTLDQAATPGTIIPVEIHQLSNDDLLGVQI